MEPGLASDNKKIRISGLPELPGARPGSGEPIKRGLINRSCQDPGLALDNIKVSDFGFRSCQEPDLAPVNQK